MLAKIQKLAISLSRNECDLEPLNDSIAMFGDLSMSEEKEAPARSPKGSQKPAIKFKLPARDFLTHLRIF